ncbi:hypothetical protein BDZ90DRAFT_17653 [Jaminaea rosea]|uniref:HIT-type domain-containing protein n=1 Tax=Jaminaea rosea TaxID=1569628 RepID=A0A316V0N6_9BASI|nr:hypothetical protein BDZ90DRAFT_17653 [Jaminaea rosea]PWN30558.1 hypothetical protein BDZ90DRAFT_17653 [Jaminaea rosea]
MSSRKRSQRKASSLATAAISLQSTDQYDGVGRSAAGPSVLASKPLTVQQRQQLDEERREHEEKERQSKRRKVRKRLDELERTNYRDAISSSRPGIDSASRNEAEGVSIPNSVLEEAVKHHKEPSGSRLSLAISDVPGEGDRPSSSAPQRKQSATVRRLLNYRRGYYSLLEDAASDEVFTSAACNYDSASASVDPLLSLSVSQGKGTSGVIPTAGLIYPRRPPFCTVCSQAASVNCPRCGDRTCAASACLETHNDARCDRPIR